MWPLLGRSLPLIAAGFVPQATSAALVGLSSLSGNSDELTSFLGLIAAFNGLALVLSVGASICTIRDLARQGDDSGKGSSSTQVVRRNLQIANALSLCSVVFALLFMIGYSAVVDPSFVGVAWGYFVAQSMVLLTAPHSAVFNGTFQFLDRNRENLYAALAVGLVTIAAAVVVLTILPVTSVSLVALGLIQSAAAMGVLSWRRRSLGHRLAVPKWSLAVRWRRNEIFDRVAASIDGAVFMAVFVLVQVLAAAVSPQVGAQVAVAVALVRTIVVPVKQIGLNYGRLLVTGQAPRLGAARELRTLSLATWWIIVPITIGGLFWAVLTEPLSGSWTLTILILIQLLIEPLAGVLYGTAKVTIGPRAGLLGLLIIYVVALPAALLPLSISGGTAEQFWLLLVIARGLFAATTTTAWFRGAPR